MGEITRKVLIEELYGLAMSPAEDAVEVLHRLGTDQEVYWDEFDLTAVKSIRGNSRVGYEVEFVDRRQILLDLLQVTKDSTLADAFFEALYKANEPDVIEYEERETFCD